MLSLFARPAGRVCRQPVLLLSLLLLIAGLPACANDRMDRPSSYHADPTPQTASAPATSAKTAPAALSPATDAPRPPTRGTPAFEVSSHNSVATVAECVSRGVARFNVPVNFIHRDQYADGSISVRLSPPGQLKRGPEVAIAPNGDSSRVSLYSNGMVLSGKWRALVRKCAS